MAAAKLVEVAQEGAVVDSPAGEALGRHTGACVEGEGRQLGGEKVWGGHGENGLLLEGDATHPFVVQESRHCDRLGCTQIDRSSLQ